MRHPNGYKTIYAHLSDVKVGMNDRIEGGETVLGLAGNTGNVWPEPTPQNPFLGTHLHLTVKHDNAKKGGSLYVGFGYNIADPSDLVEPLLGEQSSGSGQSGSNAGSNQGSSQNVRYVSASAGLFLRPVMNTSQPEIDRMPYASRVTVISEHGNWLKVDYNGKTGYAWKGWLSRDKPNNR